MGKLLFCLDVFYCVWMFFILLGCFKQSTDFVYILTRRKIKIEWKKYLESRKNTSTRQLIDFFHILEYNLFIKNCLEFIENVLKV